MKISVIDRVENIVMNGENAGYQHFLLFPQYFSNDSFPGSFKVELCVNWFTRNDPLFALVKWDSLPGANCK